MKLKNFKISMLKTYYPHWEEHTAFNSILQYFNRQCFNLNMQNVPMGDETFHSPSFIKKYCRKIITKKQVQEYKLNDLRAKITIFSKTFFKKIDVVHFFNSEHTLMFFPYWNKRFRFLRSSPKIIAMFHQPPSILKKLINFKIIWQVDHVLVVFPTQEERFAQYLPRERISTIFGGVDTDHLKPAPKTKTSKIFKLLGGGVWLRDYDEIFATTNTFLPEGGACGLTVISSDIPYIES